MEAPEVKMYDEATRLKLLRTNIQSITLPKLPLVATGSGIVADPAALERSISADVAKYFPAMPTAEQQQLSRDLLKQFNSAATTLPFNASDLANTTNTPKRTLLMAPPQKHTRIFSRADKAQIYKQWFCVQHALVQAGGHLDIIPHSDGMIGVREVFTRDRYVMIGDTAYLPDVRVLPTIIPGQTPAERELIAHYEAEVASVERTLQERGIKTIVVEGGWFEGGNVIRHFGKRTLFAGIYKDWFSLESAQKLLDAVNNTQGESWSLVPVPMENYAPNPYKAQADMYHLDTGMSEPLPRGEVLLSRLLTDDETYVRICDAVGPEKIIHISDYDARNLATNLIDVGNTLIMTNNCYEAREKLWARGYNVIMPDDYGLESFSFGGAGVHCLTNDVPPLAHKQRAPLSL